MSGRIDLCITAYSNWRYEWVADSIVFYLYLWWHLAPIWVINEWPTRFSFTFALQFTLIGGMSQWLTRLSFHHWMSGWLYLCITSCSNLRYEWVANSIGLKLLYYIWLKLEVGMSCRLDCLLPLNTSYSNLSYKWVANSMVCLVFHFRNQIIPHIFLQ